MTGPARRNSGSSRARRNCPLDRSLGRAEAATVFDDRRHETVLVQTGLDVTASLATELALSYQPALRHGKDGLEGY